MAPQVQILALAFKGLNILDLTGPAEVFGNSELRPACHITTASASGTPRSAEGVTLKTDISFDKLLENDSANLATYDVLVIPGAPPEFIDEALAEDTGLLDVIKAFAALKSSAGKQKWLFSICTGAGFLGAVGLLNGTTCTTHWGYIPDLNKLLSERGEAAKVVKKRFVSVGKTESGVKIVTSGGVSCGMDAALWILSQLFSLEKAKEIAHMMDYEWKFGGNKVTQDWIV